MEPQLKVVASNSLASIAQLPQVALVPPPSPVVPVAPAAISSLATRRVADVIVQTLKDLGVDTFYGIPGGAICPIYDALHDQPSLRVINTRHETGAAFMAMGHAKV